MFIVVKKVHSRRIIALAALASVAVALSGAGAQLTRADGPALIQTAGTVQVDGSEIRSNEDRVAYLTRWGWEVQPDPASIEEVLIPETLDASYEEYLALQASQGFDLAAYAGKTVRRYTYQVTNYPALRQNVWAVLLVYHRTVVGGEVYCSSGDGFTQGLAFPGRDRQG